MTQIDLLKSILVLVIRTDSRKSKLEPRTLTGLPKPKLEPAIQICLLKLMLVLVTQIDLLKSKLEPRTQTDLLKLIRGLAILIRLPKPRL